MCLLLNLTIFGGAYKIKYLSNNELKMKSVADYKKIDSSFAVLNAIFYLNKTIDEGIKEEEILELLNL